MAKTLEHPRAAAILLKLLADDPSMVEFLNRDNLVDFIKLELYDGHDLKLTAKGRKFVQQHLSKQEDPDEGSWHGDFSRNPVGVVTKKHGEWGLKYKPGKGYRSVSGDDYAWHMISERQQHLAAALKGKAVPFEIDEMDDAHLTFEKTSDLNPRKKRNPEIENHQGFHIYEARSEARLGFFKSGRGGKVIRGKHYFWIMPPDHVEDKSIDQQEFKTLAAARKFLLAYLKSKNPRKKKNVSNAKFEQVISDYFEEI